MTDTSSPTATAGPATFPEPAADEIGLASVLHALADPVRLRIVASLARTGSEANCLAFDLPVAKSTLTHHFRVLREAGLIRQVRRGTSRMNTLRTDDLAARFPGLLDSVIDGHHREECAERRP